MQKYILLLAMIALCSLNPATPVINDEPSVQQSNTLFINSDVNSELNRLDFFNDDANLVGYKVNTTGAYKVEFKAQSGAGNLLRGTARGLSATGVSFPIAGNDTFRIRNVSNNAIVKTIILAPSGEDMSKLIYGAKRYPSYDITQTTDYVNNWLNATLPTLKFERTH